MIEKTHLVAHSKVGMDVEDCRIDMYCIYNRK